MFNLIGKLARKHVKLIAVIVISVACFTPSVSDAYVVVVGHGGYGYHHPYYGGYYRPYYGGYYRPYYGGYYRPYYGGYYRPYGGYYYNGVYRRHYRRYYRWNYY